MGGNVIELRITGDSYSQIKQQLSGFMATIESQNESVGEEIQSSPVEEAPAKKVTKKKAKKKAAKKASAKTAPPQEPEEETQESGDINYSKDDVLHCLQLVNTTKGLPTARRILNSFEANRVIDLSEQDFGDFIKACAKECGREVKDVLYDA